MIGRAGITLSALAFVAAAPAPAQEGRARDDAPVVRVYSQSGGAISSYVTPVIEVRENAYVMVISVDLDRDVQVLYPAYPDHDGFLEANERERLPNFFAGHPTNRMVMTDPLYGSYRYSTWGAWQPTVTDARGTVIAIASRTPFNFASLARRGDWNYAAIRLLVGSRGPNSLALALARRLGARGNSFGYDVYRFAGGQTYYASAFPICDLVYGDPFGVRYLEYAALSARMASARNGSLRIVGYDRCGNPFVTFVPERQRVVSSPVGYPPLRDTADRAFPAGRIPRAVPRPGANPGEAEGAAVGAFPAARLPRTEPARGDFPVVLPERLAPRPSAPQSVPETPRSFPERREPVRPAPVAQPRNDDVPARLTPPRERMPEPVRTPDPEPVRRYDPPPAPAPAPPPMPERAAPAPRPEVKEAPVVPPPAQ